jgi:hypothetical protein
MRQFGNSQVVHRSFNEEQTKLIVRVFRGAPEGPRDKCVESYQTIESHRRRTTSVARPYGRAAELPSTVERNRCMIITWNV